MKPRDWLLALLGLFFGFFFTAFAWFLLYGLFWMPSRRQLGQWNVEAHDVGGTFLIGFGAPFIGILFALTSIASLYMLRRMTEKKYSERELFLSCVAMQLTPGLIVIGLSVISAAKAIYSKQGPIWDYPLSGAAVLLIGFGWGLILFRVGRRRLPRGGW